MQGSCGDGCGMGKCYAQCLLSSILTEYYECRELCTH